MKHIRSMNINGISFASGVTYTIDDVKIIVDVTIKSQGLSMPIRNKRYNKQMFFYFYDVTDSTRKGAVCPGTDNRVVGYIDLLKTDEGYLTAKQIKYIAKKMLDIEEFCVLILKNNPLAISLRDIAYQKEGV